ncbi:MAG: recombinase family protein [Defluviitaleaceae bacterium]|nr:recombinase family protein [Defluviitaleaceae bacterium]
MKKAAAIYIRVSTDAQREEGYSIDAQKEMLQAHCVSKGIKNYIYYIDGGFTGSNIDRPEMQRLISDIKQDKISHVLVYKLDRLSRSQKDTLYLIEDVFNPHGVDFISMNESMDTSTPLGRLMLGILSAFAQLERENIRERTRMGMRERVKSGKWMGGGRTPFGYDYDEKNGTLIPNKDAERVRKVYELYLQGHSTANIAKTLGLKYDKLAYQILSRKSNAGYITYNGEEYLGNHEPIISLETYECAMRYMNERSVKRVSESGYLFTGLLYCGKCGAKMRYQKWGKHDCKIVCYSQDKSKPHIVKDPNCDNAKLWASDIEDVVLKDLFNYSFEQRKIDTPQISNMSLLEVLHDQYGSVAQKLKRLYNLYAESDDEILNQTISETKKELKHIQVQIENETEKSKNQNNFINLKKTLSTLSETWEYMTSKEKKLLVNDCINKITITDAVVHIDYKFDLVKEW